MTGYNVSIHAPAWGATWRSRLAMWSTWFQSTPPRGGRHWRGHDRVSTGHVSIHAPAWGATPDEFMRLARLSVSIHAPAWGATAGCGATVGLRTRFNPRPRVGGDARLSEYGRELYNVSIHAPAWGATSTPTTKASPGYRFQSTPPRGGRPVPPVSASVRDEFQSTPPRGGRRDVTVYYHVPVAFQSTPPRGGRRSAWSGSRRTTRFQSTPPRGGRQLPPYPACRRASRGTSRETPHITPTIGGGVWSQRTRMALHGPGRGFANHPRGSLRALHSHSRHTTKGPSGS